MSKQLQKSHLLACFTLTMRILAITHIFPNEHNPKSGIFAARQLLELVNQGHEVTVLSPVVWAPPLIRCFRRWEKYNHSCRYYYKNLAPLVIPILCLPGIFFNPLHNRFAYIAMRRKAINLHRSKPYDIVYARWLFPDGYAAMRLSRDLAIPAVAVTAGSDLNIQASASAGMQRDLQTILTNLDGLITSGQLASERIEALTGRRPLALHGVVDIELFCPPEDKVTTRKTLGIDPDQKILLYLGALLKTKGVFEMMQAFLIANGSFPDSALIICGDGGERANMEAFIREAGAEKAIRLVGAVDPDHVPAWMQAADVFVLASYSEGMPNAVMEAMACGLPTIATTVGGLPHELHDCEGAILVEPREVSCLAAAMVTVLSDIELRKRMGIASRKKAVERFSVQRNARTLIDYFEQICKVSINTY